MTITAKRLKTLREKMGLSQTEIAARLGIDRTTYVKYENGGSIKRSQEKLAELFEVSVDYLLGNDITISHIAPPTSASEIDEFIKNQFANEPQVLAILNRPRTKVLASDDLYPSINTLPEDKKKEIKNAILLGLHAAGYNV